VFHVSTWGAWSFVWGYKPTKDPVAMGMCRLWTKGEYAADLNIFSYKL